MWTISIILLFLPTAGFTVFFSGKYTVYCSLTVSDKIIKLKVYNFYKYLLNVFLPSLIKVQMRHQF